VKIIQRSIGKASQLSAGLAALQAPDADLLLVFAAVEYFTATGFVEALRAACPRAILLGCTTAGEITGDGVNDGSCATDHRRTGR